MAYIVNTVVYDTFDLLDDSGAAITGKTNSDFTSSAFLISNTSDTATVTVTEVNAVSKPGKYRISFTPDTVGAWDVTVVYSGTTPPRRFGGTYNVVTAQQADPMASDRGIKLDNLDALVAGVAALLVTPTLPPPPPGGARTVTLNGQIGFLSVVSGTLVFTPAS